MAGLTLVEKFRLKDLLKNNIKPLTELNNDFINDEENNNSISDFIQTNSKINISKIAKALNMNESEILKIEFISLIKIAKFGVIHGLISSEEFHICYEKLLDLYLPKLVSMNYSNVKLLHVLRVEAKVKIFDEKLK